MKRKYIVKISIFLLGFTCLFVLVQDILQKKWYYPNWYQNTYKTVNDIYYLDENSIDVAFLGTSHVQQGISPMEIYEYNGVVSYNLGTIGQPIEISYYLLKEFMEKQQPKVVFLDCSNLFYDESSSAYWRYVIDSMKFGKTKLELANDYSTNDLVSQSDGFISTVFPIYKYHSRWKELSSGDFCLVPNRSFMKGYYIWSSAQKAPCSVEMMNTEMDYIAELENNGLTTWNYESERGSYESEKNDILIYDVVTEEGEKYLRKIIELCEENNSELILTKVPSVYYPELYNGVWTIKKYQEIKLISEKYDIKFLDLLYDGDIDIDWNTDSVDGGRHLNILGSEKVSRYYARYLQSSCGIKGKKSEEYEEALLKYNDVRQVVELEMQSDFEEYLQTVAKLSNVTILISASNDFASDMSDSQLIYFQNWMTNKNFSENLDEYSFVSVIDNGSVVYEAFSQSNIDYCYEAYDKEFRLKTYGIKNIAVPSILIDGVEVGKEKAGINIVIYDNEVGCVIDSVLFYFVDQTGYVYRTTEDNLEILDEYIYSIGG